MTLHRIKTFNNFRTNGQIAVVTSSSLGAGIHERTASTEMAWLARPKRTC
jgi:hypothetical protein